MCFCTKVLAVGTGDEDTCPDGANLGTVATAGTDCTDGPLNTGALNDGALNEGALNEGALNDGACNAGALNEGELNAGPLNEGACNAAGLKTCAFETNGNDWMRPADAIEVIGPIDERCAEAGIRGGKNEADEATGNADAGANDTDDGANEVETCWNDGADGKPADAKWWAAINGSNQISSSNRWNGKLRAKLNAQCNAHGVNAALLPGTAAAPNDGPWLTEYDDPNDREPPELCEPNPNDPWELIGGKACETDTGAAD